ncbi:hypothetical protein QTO34_016180 [Cnephaeus nilssonii]|uniref:Cadherin domain-containing protein n=1 Tax=Cnephaeus nilssonii TaxID=3371016 RepID=A0AA40I6G8_CNENI|nr:hypothetical protein QTO34_016180 [Eptesicus nilssonii]
MVVALFKTRDWDSGENGKVTCNLSRNVPFKIHSSSNNYYKLVTDGALDRELTPEYNVTITATDRGKPPLSSSTTITLHLTDVNDNAPVFQQSAYLVHVPENNPPGASIAQRPGATGAVSYVSVSAHSGVVFAQRAFDHEQLRAFELTLQARDQGSPALSANVSLRVLVGDRNDNAPRVLYPALGPDGSALFDTVPRAAQPGYLVTKVVAVDADSGHNAWLSYHVLQASEPGLFSLGLRTGEVRTARALGDRDAARQRLLVAVRDGGQPPLSATATLLLVFADSLQEALPDLSDHPTPSDPQAELQFYLVVALALISVLFLMAVILAIALRLRSSYNPATGGCFGSVLCSKSGPEIPPNYSEGTLPYAYNLCVPGDQTNTELNFLTSADHCPATQDTLNKDSSLALLAGILTPSVEANKKTFKQLLRLDRSGLVLLYIFLGTLREFGAGQIRYSVPEETDKGFFVGNISKDLGLEPGSWRSAASASSPERYQLNPNSYFSLQVGGITDGAKNPELVLEGTLDREKEAAHLLLLTALDGGDPIRQGTVPIRVVVLMSMTIPQSLHSQCIETRRQRTRDPVPALPTDGSTGVELAPRSAEPGYLVTKVVAVDRDSGQNAWLSYRLLKASEPGLFTVGLHTGESLVVAVQDHGQPPLSATVTLTVAIADSIPDVLADLGSLESPTNPDDSGLTLYLVMAVAVVSCVFLAFVIVLLALRLRRWHTSRLLQASGGTFAGVPASHFVGVDGVQAFLQTYSHEVSLTADPGKSHLIFPQPNYADTLISQESCGKSEPLLIVEDSVTV